MEREWGFHPTGQTQQRNLTHDGGTVEPVPGGHNLNPEAKPEPGRARCRRGTIQPTPDSVGAGPSHYRGSGHGEA